MGSECEMKISDILSVLPIRELNQSIEDKVINSVKMDHQLIEPGDVFVCIQGFTVDGHQFAKEAIVKGAILIVAEYELDLSNCLVATVPNTSRALTAIASKYYNYPSANYPLIGITGTNGKTTTSYIIEAIIQENKMKTGLIGTIQAKINEEIIPIKNTTPNALELQRIFAEMVKNEVDTVMIEVSSHALDLGRVYGSDFDIAVFTNLTQDHLDYHIDMADYLRAKTLLFSYLGNSYVGNPKYAVLNADDKHSVIIEKSTAQAIITYGVKNEANIRARNIIIDITGTRFTLETIQGNIEIKSQLIGNFNVYNILAAATVATLLKIPLPVIKTAIENFSGVDGRFERVQSENNFAVIVDYAHTADSLENVLQTIKGFSKRKVYVVIGTGGDRDKTKRPLMAEMAVKYADLAIFTTDNPRTEDPNDILSDMISGINSDNYKVILDRKAAISLAVSLAAENDVILIAGKGHETYQEINGIKYDFDDRLVAKEAIKQKVR